MNKKTLSTILFFIALTSFFIVEKNLKATTGVPYILDKMIYYNEDSVRQIFNTLGANGRKMYHYLHSIDYIFIMSFGFMQSVLINDRISKVKLELKSGNGILFIPIILRGITDIGENIILDKMLVNYPDINSLLVKAAYTMTFLKWIFLAIIIVEIIYLTIISKKGKISETCTG